MSTRSPVTAIWNRALDVDRHPSFSSPGDIALRDVLTFDAAVRDVGLTEAISTFEDDDEYPLSRVIGGYSYLGLDDTADVLQESWGQVSGADDDVLEALEIEVDPQYDLEEADLEQALADRLSTSPEDFDSQGGTA